MERSRLAHDVLEGHLRLSSHTLQLFRQLADALLVGDQDLGTGEKALREKLRADLASLRDMIAYEVAFVDEVEQEGERGKAWVKLNTLLEQSIDGSFNAPKLGADDYLTKPFAFDELLAWLEALVRRAGNFERPTERLACGALVFDRESMIATCDEERLDLTAKEIAILDLFLGAPGKVFSRQRILLAVWGCDSDPLTNVVDVDVGRLRRKIGAGPDVPSIETLRGPGYRLDKPQSEQIRSDNAR